MTSVRSQSRIALPSPPVRVEPAKQATVRRLRVRWVVARAAILRASIVGDAPQSGPPLTLEIECEFAGERCVGASAWVHDPATDQRHDITPALWRAGPPADARLMHDAERGLDHADIPGVLAATLRAGNDAAPDILYARTPLLAALGIPGGAADPGGGAFDTGGRASSKRHGAPDPF